MRGWPVVARRRVPDELAHEGEVAVDTDRSGVARLVAGDEAQQRRLADAVRTDERHPLTVADMERHVVEEGRPPGRRQQRWLTVMAPTGRRR